MAVDHLTVDMFEGQIFALLGVNGAGKSTTISMLTGLYSATAGTATVNGYSISAQMNNVRQSIGVCPQVIIFSFLLNNWNAPIFFQHGFNAIEENCGIHTFPIVIPNVISH